MKFFFRKDKPTPPPPSSALRAAGWDLDLGYEAALPFLSPSPLELTPEVQAANDPARLELPPRLAAGC